MVPFSLSTNPRYVLINVEQKGRSNNVIFYRKHVALIHHLISNPSWDSRLTVLELIQDRTVST